mgnify:CR=1 FL=1
MLLLQRLLLLLLRCVALFTVVLCGGRYQTSVVVLLFLVYNTVTSGASAQFVRHMGEFCHRAPSYLSTETFTAMRCYERMIPTSDGSKYLLRADMDVRERRHHRDRVFVCCSPSVDVAVYVCAA